MLRQMVVTLSDRKIRLLLLPIIIILAQADINAANASHDRPYCLGRRDLTCRLASLTNFHRTAYQLPQASRSYRLNGAAQGYARFLASVDGEGHHADGKDVSQRVREAGFGPFCFVAENVYVSWSTTPEAGWDVAKKAVEWWKQSPGHNANMLNRNSNHIGTWMAKAQHGNRHVWKVVQVFAAPPGTCR
jgi:uncharacterized protein YkwD